MPISELIVILKKFLQYTIFTNAWKLEEDKSEKIRKRVLLKYIQACYPQSSYT